MVYRKKRVYSIFCDPSVLTGSRNFYSTVVFSVLRFDLVLPSSKQYGVQNETLIDIRLKIGCYATKIGLNNVNYREIMRIYDSQFYKRNRTSPV